VLDSHVSRSDIHVVLLRVARALRLVACVALIAATLPDDLSAQERDSARVGAVPAPGPRRAAPVDTVPEPPISPGRAFFSSLLVPGLGQSELDRPIAGMIFVAVEAVSIVMIQKSQKELAYAKRVGKIGVPCPGDDTGLLCLDPGPPSGNPPTYPEADTPNRYSGGRITARRQHVEDWVALLVANHLLAGAEAYVAAHLWDLPARVGARPVAGGVAIAASLSW
jgi:hypothetical protein